MSRRKALKQLDEEVGSADQRLLKQDTVERASVENEHSESTLEPKARYEVVRANQSDKYNGCSCRPKEKKFEQNYYYSVLNVDSLASQADIDLVYQTALNKFQLLKDRQNGLLTDEQAGELTELNFAYKIVGNPKCRKIYDKHGLRGVLFVEKYGGNQFVSYTAGNSTCSSFCFLVFSCLTLCWGFACCFGFCFCGLFCCYCCNYLCGGCAKQDQSEYYTHGSTTGSDNLSPNLQDSMCTILERQAQESNRVSTKCNDSATSADGLSNTDSTSGANVPQQDYNLNTATTKEEGLRHRQRF